MAKIIILLLVLFIPVFVLALLCFIAFVLSCGGWRTLGRQFAAKNTPTGTPFYRVVGMVGGSSYKGAMKAIVAADGLFLDVSPVFRLGHKPLFIPFGAISDIRKTMKFRGDYVTFAVGNPAVMIALPSAVFKGTPVALG